MKITIMSKIKKHLTNKELYNRSEELMKIELCRKSILFY